MDKIKLTYGFEIEGLFSQKLYDQINSAGLGGEFQDDGSVDIRCPDEFKAVRSEDEECNSCEGVGYYEDSCDCDDELECTDQSEGHTHGDSCYIRNCGDDPANHRNNCSDCSGTGRREANDVREYASGVFDEADKMLDTMQMFDPKNYVWDFSCGLHLHIGGELFNEAGANIDEASAELKSVFCDYKFLQAVRKSALNEFCSHQAERLARHASYCEWVGRQTLINTFYNHHKYSFLNFHPQGTLEFRFLCPCEHKIANVKKLLAMIDEHLNKRIEYVKTISVPGKISRINVLNAKVPSVENIEVVHKLDKQTEIINL